MKLLKIDELAAKIQIPISTIYQWTSRKRIPYIKLRGRIRFEEETIEKWLKEMRIQTL